MRNEEKILMEEKMTSEKKAVMERTVETEFIKGENADFYVNGGSLVIVPDCDIDHHNCVILKSEADRLIERNNIKNVVFDFKNVDFMDSSGIGVIIGRYKKISYTGGNVYFRGVSAAVDRILKISGLYRIAHKENEEQ